MGRVSFARDPLPISDEREPLLDTHARQASQASSSASGSVPRAPSILVSSARPPLSPRSGSSDDSSTYLPLHRRQKKHTRKRNSYWKAGTCAAGLVLILNLVVLTTFLLDRPPHPTGPFPAPPSRGGKHDQTDSDREGGRNGRNPAYLIKAQNGAVASENEVCSEMGVGVLKDGGNAIDAAIATTFCIGVTNFFSSGIGGGGFMTVRIPSSSSNAESNSNSSSEVWTIDFRETASALANNTMFDDDPYSSKYGGLSVGVPGEVRGLAEAHKRWGSLPWARLVQPSAALAAGWKVGRELGLRLELYRELMFRDPIWTEIFAPEGRILREDEIVRRTSYSRTLATIASEGPEAFYKGPIADALISAINNSGGILTQADLDAYEVKVYRSLEGTYRGRKVYTPRAPTSGPVLLHMLNLLERYDLEGEGRTGLNVHRLVEVIKFGFAARTKICDPDFTNDTARIDEISTKLFGKLISPNVTDERTHSAEYYNPIYDVPLDHGTSHTSVVDKDGMAVAITSTVNLVFGSQVMDRTTGVLLNDEMDDFSTPGLPNAFGLWPSPYNYPEPGKRPLSSTSPTILEHADGSFYAALGGSGGSKIFPAVAQVLLGFDSWGLDVSEAIEAGRVHDQLYPAFVEVDDVLPREEVEALRERGHNVTMMDVNRIAAVIQAVVKPKDSDVIYAASDSRKNGIAAGY